MKERIGYIDSLKGLAILLMVMGHVIARQFPDWEVIAREAPHTALLVWRIIYSFHMPLFMFCSGLLALRIKEYTWKSVGTTIWKRACSLLLPFFTMGYIKYLTQGGEFLDYWYLWTLFQFMIVVLIIDGLCSLLPKYSTIVSTSIVILSAILVHVFWNRFMPLYSMPFIDVWHWNLFPYFCMGIICARYDLCTKWFSKNWVYTSSLVVFIVLTYVISIKGIHIPKQSLTGCLLPISAIVVFVYLFKVGVNEMAKPVQWLQDLGKHSLEIYILHGFFLLHMYSIGDYVLQLAHRSDEGATIFLIQFVSSLVVSILIIALCYIVMNMINKSDILSQVLLGRKYKG